MYSATRLLFDWPRCFASAVYIIDYRSLLPENVLWWHSSRITLLLLSQFVLFSVPCLPRLFLFLLYFKMCQHCFIYFFQIEGCCCSLESRLQGVSEVQSHVRDVFSRLADLDDELDSLSPVGRDADSLASQADALQDFLSRLTNLKTELEGHASECTSMLRREGSSPDLLALRRETEALSRQAGKVWRMEGANLWSCLTLV